MTWSRTERTRDGLAPRGPGRMPLILVVRGRNNATLLSGLSVRTCSQRLISFRAGPPKGGTVTGPFVAML